MVGTIPKTNLLLVCNTGVVGHFDTYYDLCVYLGYVVDMNTGQITNKDNKCYPIYNTKDDKNSWNSMYEILNDFAKKHMELPFGFQVYQYLV
jgi:hypothetical protein